MLYCFTSTTINTTAAAFPAVHGTSVQQPVQIPCSSKLLPPACFIPTSVHIAEHPQANHDSVEATPPEHFPEEHDDEQLRSGTRSELFDGSFWPLLVITAPGFRFAWEGGGGYQTKGSACLLPVLKVEVEGGRCQAFCIVR